MIITADHGEDLGEFGVYGEHGMADEPVCRIPLFLRNGAQVFQNADK